jgi:DNA-binding NtrC family response regulator
MKPSILIIDDEDKIRRFLGEPFTRRGYRVSTAGTGRQGLEVFRKEEPEIVILDMRLPDVDGMQVLREIRRASPEHIVIMITAYGEIRLAVEAMKLGAFDYLTKPFEFDAINIVIGKASEYLRMKNEIACLKRESDLSGYEDMVGKSKRMQEVFRRIEEIASSPAPLIFLNGETGTGKELAARAIHRKSARAAGPFVALNCTILDERLLQSELFGHEKGAFTDATETKKGLFEVADGGTIFLDEIGDITPLIQAKLLRVLEEKSFRRLGGTKDISVDVRIVISTNRDLKAAVAAGHFREDLYFSIPRGGGLVGLHRPLRRRHAVHGHQQRRGTTRGPAQPGQGRALHPRPAAGHLGVPGTGGGARRGDPSGGGDQADVAGGEDGAGGRFCRVPLARQGSRGPIPPSPP